MSAREPVESFSGFGSAGARGHGDFDDEVELSIAGLPGFTFATWSAPKMSDRAASMTLPTGILDRFRGTAAEVPGGAR